MGMTGSKGLISACSHGFEVLGDIFNALPIAVRLCVYACVGLFLLVGFFKLLSD